jgi:hypothetical protein
MMTMLICNEGKDDKKYHIAYQLNTASPTIPYCRTVGHLDVPVQVMSTNPKVCTRCKAAAGIVDAPPMAEVVPLPVGETNGDKALKALKLIVAVADEAMSEEAYWWKNKIEKACEEAGVDLAEPLLDSHSA